MSTMLVVPAGVVGHVREGLFGVLAPVCASLAQAQAGSIGGRRCGWQQESLARLERVGALLKVVGRSAGWQQGRVMVNVAEHGWTLLEALDCEVRVLERLVGEAMVYQPDGPGCRRLSGKLRVLREFAGTVEERVLAAATPVGARRSAGLGGGCVGDVEVVERVLLDLVPVDGLGSVQRHAWEPFSGSRCRGDFAACCLHRARG